MHPDMLKQWEQIDSKRIFGSDSKSAPAVKKRRKNSEGKSPRSRMPSYTGKVLCTVRKISIMQFKNILYIVHLGNLNYILIRNGSLYF